MTMTQKKFRTEKYYRLCERAERMRNNIPVDKDALAEWWKNIEKLENDLYDLEEDGIDRDYLGLLYEVGVIV